MDGGGNTRSWRRVQYLLDRAARRGAVPGYTRLRSTYPIRRPGNEWEVVALADMSDSEIESKAAVCHDPHRYELLLYLRRRSLGEAQRGLSLELKLPAWFTAAFEQGGSVPEALYQFDASPDQFASLINHCDSIISGAQEARRRFALMRDTALARGCDRDAPISTVFDDRRPPPAASDRPIP